MHCLSSPGMNYVLLKSEINLIWYWSHLNGLIFCCSESLLYGIIQLIVKKMLWTNLNYSGMAYSTVGWLQLKCGITHDEQNKFFRGYILFFYLITCNSMNWVRLYMYVHMYNKNILCYNDLNLAIVSHRDSIKIAFN